MEFKQKEERIFKNPILETFTRTSPSITLLVYVPLIVFLLYVNFQNQVSLKSSLLFFFLGMFLWTFLEYIIHRYLFHFTAESSLAKRVNYIMHGVHHHYPRNKNRLFMPPLPGLAIISILYFLTKLMIGVKVYSFLPGLISGYLVYVFLHYLIHTIKPPKVLEPIWTHHFTHHHRHPEKCFGVSTKLWDFIFSTLPPKNRKK